MLRRDGVQLHGRRLRNRKIQHRNLISQRAETWHDGQEYVSPSALLPTSLSPPSSSSENHLLTNQYHRPNATHPRRHPRYLWPRRLSHNNHLPQREIRSPHQLYATCRRYISWFELSSCRILYWDCWGCGSEGEWAAAEDVCGNDDDVDLCGGFGCVFLCGLKGKA